MNRIGECNITLKEFSELGRDGFNVICCYYHKHRKSPSIGSESSSGSFSPELSLKRSNSSFESLDSLAQSKSASESGRPTFDSTTSFCLSEDFSHYPDPRRELKRPKTQLPPQSGYHYVVPRSYWICNTTKLSKQKLREVYHASLVYHRGEGELREHILSAKE